MTVRSGLEISGFGAGVRLSAGLRTGLLIEAATGGAELETCAMDKRAAGCPPPGQRHRSVQLPHFHGRAAAPSAYFHAKVACMHLAVIIIHLDFAVVIILWALAAYLTALASCVLLLHRPAAARCHSVARPL